MKIHDQLSNPANKPGTCRRQTLSTRRYTLSSRNLPTSEAHADNKHSAHGDTRSAQDTGNCMKIHAQLSEHANKCSALEPPYDADKRSAQDASQLVQIHTHVSIWTSNMQIPAQLLIRAGAYRNMQSLGYVHTHAGLQYVHVHAWFLYMQMHTVTHSGRMQNNTYET
jgi:hypothetical protein